MPYVRIQIRQFIYVWGTSLAHLQLVALSGMSHSGGGDSFSPSDPLLKSCIKPLLLYRGDGRPSSSFPPGTEK